MFGRMKRHAHATMSDAQRTLRKTDVAIDKGVALAEDLAADIGEFIEQLEKNGIEGTIEIAGRKLPIKINIDLGEKE